MKNLAESLSDLELCTDATFCKSLDENVSIKTTYICEEHRCEALLTTSRNILYLAAHITEMVKNPVTSWLYINKNELEEIQGKNN